MNQFTIVGHLVEEPIENLETGEVELKINIYQNNITADVVVKTNGILADNAIKYGHIAQLIGVKGHFEDNGQLIADKITFLNTKLGEEK